MLVRLEGAPTNPALALAFKLEDGKYGQLTYMRVYEGTIKRGTPLLNRRTGKIVKVPRIVRMHSDEMQEVPEARAHIWDFARDSAEWALRAVGLGCGATAEEDGRLSPAPAPISASAAAAAAAAGAGASGGGYQQLLQA